MKERGPAPTSSDLPPLSLVSEREFCSLSLALPVSDKYCWGDVARAPQSSTQALSPSTSPVRPAPASVTPGTQQAPLPKAVRPMSVKSP